MTGFFITVLGISAATSVAILILLLLRHKLQQRYAAKWSCLLWLVIALRLALPFTLPADQAPVVVTMPHSQAALAQSQQEAPAAPSEITPPEAPLPDAGLTEAERTEPVLSGAPTQGDPAEPAAPSLLAGLTLVDGAAWVWLLGVGGYALLQLVSNLTFRRTLRRWSHVPLNPEIQSPTQAMAQELSISHPVDVMVCHAVTSPMLVGLFRPQLILPHEDCGKEELNFILRHELTHCKQKHLWFKLLLVIANAIHWFNPLVYRMAREAESDLERACDDLVMESATLQSKKAYSAVILKGIDGQAARPHHLSTQFYCTKDELKSRFFNIFDGGKKRSCRVLLTLTACVLLVCGMVACSTNPPEESASNSPDGENQIAEQLLSLLYTSNLDGRYDAFQASDKGSAAVGDGGVSTSAPGTAALEEYYAGLQPLTTEQGYQSIAANNYMLSLDQLAAEYDCAFSPSEFILANQDGETVWNYSVQVTVFHQGETLGTVTQTGQLSLAEQEGQQLVDSFWTSSLGELRAFLIEEFGETEVPESEDSSATEAPVDADAASTPEEELARLYLTLFFTSNWGGRYDTLLESGMTSLDMTEDALYQYYSCFQSLCTELDFSDGVDFHNSVVFYDELAAEYNCSFVPSKISLSPSDDSSDTSEDASTTWNYTVNVSMVQQDESLCTLTWDGQITLVRQDGQLLVDSHSVEPLGQVRAYLEWKFPNTEDASSI